MTRAATSTCLACAVLASFVACDGGTPLERSCDGEVVAGCRPYQYVELRAFTLEPTSARRDDVFVDLRVHGELGRCDGETATAVGVRLEAEYAVDGSVRVLPLFSVADNGASGDPVAADGVVDSSVENPFTGLVPTGPMVIHARAFSPSCEGDDVVSVDFELLPAP